MRFGIASLAGVVSLLSFVSAQVDLANPGDSAEGSYIDPEEQTPFLYDINYNVVGKPLSDVIEFYNGDEITLNYTFTNNEQEDVTIVGVGGSFADPTNGQIVANITDAKIGPIAIPPGQSQIFNQRVGINLPAGNYLLIPGLYVVKASSLALLGARTQLAIVSDKPVSLLSPQLLILELLLIGTLGLGGYFAWVNFGASYFKTTSKTANVSKAPIAAAPLSAQSTGSKKSVDESWLPEHLKKTNKRKAK